MKDVQGIPPWTKRIRAFHGELNMAWTKPSIAEIPAGMEINMYACAKQK